MIQIIQYKENKLRDQSMPLHFAGAEMTELLISQCMLLGKNVSCQLNKIESILNFSFGLLLRDDCSCGRGMCVSLCSNADVVCIFFAT
jgi:hypothetical protein